MAEKTETKKSKKEKNLAESVIEEAVEIGKKTVKKVEESVEELMENIEESITTDKKEKTSRTNSQKSALEKLKEKAKALELKVKEEKVDLKKKVRSEEEEAVNTLVPIEDYLKSSIHLGTRVITPDMRSYVYKRRADGLAVFNTSLLDENLRQGADYLAKFSPEDIILVCKREAGWKAANLFSKATGIRVFTKKYPAGILTNPNLDTFIETELIFICDPWLDKNALADANNIKIPVLSICDTNNYTQGITKIIPGNNKSAKSLGMILYLTAKLYVESKKIKTELPPSSEWIDDWENLTPPK